MRWRHFHARNLFIIAAALSGFGAFIEFVQGLSWVGRDRDFQDWVTDTISIGMAMLPMLAVWWRKQFERPEHAAVTSGLQCPALSARTSPRMSWEVASPCVRQIRIMSRPSNFAAATQARPEAITFATKGRISP